MLARFLGVAFNSASVIATLFDDLTAFARTGHLIRAGSIMGFPLLLEHCTTRCQYRTNVTMADIR